MSAETKHDEMYCSSCGNVVKKAAIACPHCGVAVRSNKAGKQKMTAILLAVFLGFWTWLYTYRVDAWKFWLNLGLTVVTLGIWGICVAWLWAVISTATRPEEFFENY